MYVNDAIGTEQTVTSSMNWRYRRGRYKRIQLYKTDLQEVSGRYKRIQLYRTDLQEVN